MIEPPLMSPLSAGLAFFGSTVPEGWTGEAFMPRSPGFRDLNMPDNVYERLLRALRPSIADYWTQVYSTYHQAQVSDKDAIPLITGVPSAAMSGLRRMGQRTPLVRDVLGLKPPVSGQTRITEDMYSHQKVINDLTNFYSKNVKNRGLINTKGRSRGGMALDEQYLPPELQMPGQKENMPGLPDTDIKNPLYKATMSAIEQIYMKDSPQKGGHGYLSMWSHYGIFSRRIESMRNVGDGNPQIWLEKFHNANKAEVARLEKRGIDTNDYRAVRDYYTYNRDRMAKEIMLYVRAGEQQIDKLPKVRQLLGPDKHFTLKMADPYSTQFGDLSKNPELYKQLFAPQ
jgi:hypothetical protein